MKPELMEKLTDKELRMFTTYKAAWVVVYETRQLGAQGIFKDTPFVVLADNAEHARKSAYEDATMVGLETRFAVHIEPGPRNAHSAKETEQ